MVVSTSPKGEMKMFVRIAILALAIFFGFKAVNVARAATQQEMASVRLMITDQRIPVLRRVNHVFGEKYYGTSITFVERGIRYTMYTFDERESNLPAAISFWVRKDGTSGQKNMDTFTDYDINGTADSGIDGARQHMFEDDGVNSFGLKFKPFWQAKLDTAVKAALDYKKRVTKVPASSPKRVATKR